MITKQETFKKLLSNDFREWNDLDEDMRTVMRDIFHWSLTILKNGIVAYKSVDGEWYVKSVYEDSPDWQKDILSCLKKLGRI